MADDEQFSLCWNNFNSNLSAGFHESLCRGDLVDVTLAAEGQFVKAHRLVLSVCSPYFRKMFTQMPPNQHAFVFLKDVSHTALKDLIQFMYCGEVNVKQEALPAFISTAEALQIKGLTDSDPPQSQTPPEPSTPTPQIQQQIQTSPRVRQRTSTARSYKIETVEDSGDDAKQTTQIVIQTTAPTHPPQATITTQPQQQQQQSQQQQHHHQPQHITQQTLHTQTHQITNVSMPAATTTTVVTQKRPAQRTSLGSVPHIKRSKSTIDPLEASDATAATHQINVQTTVVTDSKPQVQQQQQQQTHHHQQQQAQQHQQQSNEPEYIDLPMDLPTKSEPDYAEETGEVDQTEQDATYVEDESYGDMRYDESYFTENEDAAAATTGSGNVTATTTQNTSVTTATTSKAIVKQQPLSDSSYMDTSTDPANSDAQGSSNDLLRETKINRVPGKKGRPRKYPLSSPPKTVKISNKIAEAITKNPGRPILYASTTKGTMKLVVDGHHFRYSFRKGKYTIFQCCYKENKEECLVRVVTDQKLVYPLDGEHIHFVQATDKSVTSVKFSPAEDSEPETEYVTTVDTQEVVRSEPEPDGQLDHTTTTVFVEQAMPQPLVTNVIKIEKATAQECLEFTSELINTSSLADDDKPSEAKTVTASTEDANEFREKIKKRLQKALLGKKKQ